jgi:maltose phosphorylase
MSIVEGFGGFKVVDNQVHLNPVVPKEWDGFSFKIRFRKNVINVEVHSDHTVVYNENGPNMDLVFHGETHSLPQNKSVELKHS